MTSLKYVKKQNKKQKTDEKKNILRYNRKKCVHENARRM